MWIIMLKNFSLNWNSDFLIFFFYLIFRKTVHSSEAGNGGKGKVRVYEGLLIPN